MIPVLIFDKFKVFGGDFGEEGSLRFRLVRDVLDGFLDDSAAVGMEGKFDHVAFEEAEKLDFVDLEALFEYFLENIVAKFISN